MGAALVLCGNALYGIVAVLFLICECSVMQCADSAIRYSLLAVGVVLLLLLDTCGFCMLFYVLCKKNAPRPACASPSIHPDRSGLVRAGNRDFRGSVGTE